MLRFVLVITLQLARAVAALDERSEALWARILARAFAPSFRFFLPPSSCCLFLLLHPSSFGVLRILLSRLLGLVVGLGHWCPEAQTTASWRRFRRTSCSTQSHATCTGMGGEVACLLFRMGLQVLSHCCTEAKRSCPSLAGVRPWEQEPPGPEPSRSIFKPIGATPQLCRQCRDDAAPVLCSS